MSRSSTARATSGHVAVAPPSTVMKSRRRIAFTKAGTTPNRTRLQQGFPTGGMGSDRNFAWQQPSGSNVRFGWRAQPIDATPSNLARGGVRWRGLHEYGSRRSRGLSFGSAGRTVNVWRISLGRLGGGTRAVSIVSWLSMVALLRSRAGELRER